MRKEKKHEAWGGFYEYSHNRKRMEVWYWHEGKFMGHKVRYAPKGRTWDTACPETLSDIY